MDRPSPEAFAAAADEVARLDATGRLRWAWERFGAGAVIGTSFQGAGVVILHLAKQAGLPLPAFTLDTGLLFPETVELWRRLEKELGIRIEGVRPTLSVNAQAHAIAPELWKSDPDFCCTLRKVEPLREHLWEKGCWITGLRRDQSQGRAGTGVLELHELDPLGSRPLWKLNPLADWSRERVWEHIRAHGLPYNPLHDRGFRSIGCIPCTRVAGQGGDERAGRWTGFAKTECGIHTFTKRTKAPFAPQPADPGI
jgi:phosphoadenosine phosphosulfate reductase